MSSKREAPARRGGERRRRADGAARNSVRRPADAPQPGRTRARAGKPAAPVREARAPRTGPQTAAIGRPAPAKSTRQAKARAKARKAKAPKVVRLPLRERLINRLAAIDLRPRTLMSKVPFVVLVIGALGVGLGVTLWLSTDSAERSYQLSSARERNRVLLQQKESLEREVLEAEAAPALAEAARGLGMIPSRDAAHLVQDPAGNWVVVGSPKPAEGNVLPPLNNKLPEEAPAPAAAPTADPVEVPVRVTPGLGAPGLPGVVPGAPDVLLRAPNGATTVGAEHLPGDGSPAAVGPPVPEAGLPAPLPAAPEPVPGVGLLPGPPPQLTAPQPQPVLAPQPAPPGTPLMPGPPPVAAAPGTAR